MSTKAVRIPDPSRLRVGARIYKKRSEWDRLVMPRWVKNVVSEGFKFRFHTPPSQAHAPRQFSLSQSDRQTVDEEITLMLAHGACRDVTSSPPLEDEFLLSLFVVHQGEKNRVVFDFPGLNRFCSAPHFKMETTKDAQASILPGDFAIRGDFSKAYWGVRLHPSHRRYCRFVWRGRKYELQVLSFGASIAPFIFDSVMRVAVRALRADGVRITFYLDDWLVLDQSRQRCIDHAQMAVDLFSSLGFIVHPTKTDRSPTQRFEFLGVGFDSVRNVMFPPKAKERDIRRQASRLLQRESCSPRRLASLLGKVVFTAQVSLEARLHLSEMEAAKTSWLRVDPSWDRTHLIPVPLRKEIEWWGRLDHRLTPVWIHPPPPTVLAAGDAGPRGWGATTGCVDSPTRDHAAGLWSAQEKTQSTNVREMLALRRALELWAPRWKGQSVRWKTDSAVAARYLRKINGRVSHLTRLAKQIHRTLRKWRIDISVELVPGSEIPDEDNLSRLSDRHDYALSDAAFRLVHRCLGAPRTDLFASRYTARARRFFTRRQDPLVAGVDAFRQSWRRAKVGLALAFPPPLLARKVIQKAVWDRASLILVLPNHVITSWRPLLNNCQVRSHKALILPPGSVLGLEPVMANWSFLAIRVDFA